MAKKPDANVGIAAGVKYWLFFMLCLAFLGYGPYLSILFGAIGGIAAGVIAAWLKPKEEFVPTKAEKKQHDKVEAAKPAESKPGKRTRFRRYGTARAEARQRPQRRTGFGWLFRNR